MERITKIWERHKVSKCCWKKWCQQICLTQSCHKPSIQFGFFGCTTQLARDLSSLTRDLVWSVPTAVEAWSPNHTTAGEFPLWVIFLYKHSSFYCVLLYCTLQIVRFLVGLFVCLFVRTSLMVQWLRLWASTVGDTGLIPDLETKILCAVQHRQKREGKKKKISSKYMKKSAKYAWGL